MHSCYLIGHSVLPSAACSESTTITQRSRVIRPDFALFLQVEVESYTGSAINYDLLEGKWKLLFTTANDVVSTDDLQADIVEKTDNFNMQHIASLMQPWIAVSSFLCACFSRTKSYPSLNSVSINIK